MITLSLMVEKEKKLKMRTQFHSLLAKINAAENHFTPIDKAIADYIVNHIEKIPTLKASDVCEAVYASKASLTRFSKKIGFEGYKELKYFTESLIVESRQIQSFESNDYFSTIYMQYLQIINLYQVSLKEDEIKAFINKLKDADLIYTIGVGNSGYIAMDFANRLFRYGFKCFAITDEQFIKMHARVAKHKDLFIVISASGETKTIVQALKDLKDANVDNILLSNFSISDASKYANTTILFPGKSLKNTDFPISDLIAPTLLLDVIIAYLVNDYGDQYLTTFKKTLETLEYYSSPSLPEKNNINVK